MGLLKRLFRGRPKPAPAPKPLEPHGHSRAESWSVTPRPARRVRYRISPTKVGGYWTKRGRRQARREGVTSSRSRPDA